MVIVADDAPAAEACICKPCSAGHAQGRIIMFGSRKHNPAWSLSVAQLVVDLTISRRANDTWWQRRTIDVNCDNLLSRDAALRLGLVKRLDNINDLAFGEVGRPVQCDPIKIRRRDDATPYSISTARRMPLPLLPKVEQELQRMEGNGVIKRITEPTDWCAPMVPVMNKGGGTRICVDPKKLNRAVKRESYMLPTLEDAMHKLKGSTVFTKLDATSGFWQLPLDDETAKLTTFMTPFGRYFFRRLPFGISLAPEVFQLTTEKCSVQGWVQARPHEARRYPTDGRSV